MNPNRKFKNHGPNAGAFAILMVVIFAVVLCILVLNPIHKQNVEKIGKNLYKFQDTLELRDKDTDKMIKRLV